MFDLALHHLTDGERERAASADLQRRQVMKTAAATAMREPRPAAPPLLARIRVNPRPAER